MGPVSAWWTRRRWPRPCGPYRMTKGLSSSTWAPQGTESTCSPRRRQRQDLHAQDRPASLGGSRDQVIGAAVLAARAAAELQSAAGIESSTLTRLLGRLDRTSMEPNTVLVIDEAGMVGTRVLAVLDHARAGWRQGRSRRRSEAVTRDRCRRSARRARRADARCPADHQSPTARSCGSSRRCGSSATATSIAGSAAYHGHARIIALDSYDEAVETIVNRWAAARAQGEDAVILSVLVNEDVAGLNRSARTVVATPAWSTRRPGTVRSRAGLPARGRGYDPPQRRSPRRPQRHAWCSSTTSTSTSGR